MDFQVRRLPIDLPNLQYDGLPSPSHSSQPPPPSVRWTSKSVAQQSTSPSLCTMDFQVRRTTVNLRLPLYDGLPSPSPTTSLSSPSAHAAFGNRRTWKSIVRSGWDLGCVEVACWAGSRHALAWVVALRRDQARIRPRDSDRIPRSPSPTQLACQESRIACNVPFNASLLSLSFASLFLLAAGAAAQDALPEVELDTSEGTIVIELNAGEGSQNGR